MEENKEGGDLTKQVAAFVASQDSSRIPMEVIGKMEECLIDYVGIAAFAGANLESSASIIAGISAMEQGKGSFTVVGNGMTWPQQGAAILNGAFAHSMDFDDTHGAAALHPGAAVISAALGWAELTKPTGREFLEAIAIGYEIACRVGLALNTQNYKRGFHPTPVAGVFGAVAVACRMLKVGCETIENAFGLVGSLSSGSMQYMEDGAWNKRLHPGFAAGNSVLAVNLACAGVRGARKAFEGRYGLFSGYAETPVPQRLVEKLGEVWTAADTAIKPYPSCRATHPAIEAALKLRKAAAGLRLSEPSLHLTLRERAWELVGEPKPYKLTPTSVVDAQFSAYFQVACAWIDGKVTWQSYERIGSEEIQRLASRITVTADDSLPPMGCVLSLTGTALREMVVGAQGEPLNPLSRDTILQKFLSMAVPVFGEKRSETLSEQLLGMRFQPSADRIIKEMRG